MTIRRRTATLFAALLCSAAALAQQPAKPAREATLGGGGAAAAGPTLTREQLRQCLVEQHALKTSGDELARESRAIDVEKAELTREGEQLKQQQDTVDKTNADALLQIVERSKAHDERVDAFNAKLRPLNDRVAALQQRRTAWQGDCADRRYREDDLILLQARGQVPKR